MLAFFAWIMSVCFLATGAFREGKRRSWPGVWLCLALAVSFLISLPIVMLPPPRFVLFAAVECFALWCAVQVWHRWGDPRAAVIAAIAFGKLALRWGASKGYYPESNAYAACLNGAFVVQCLVAGGLLNGMGTWIVDRWRAFADWRGRDSKHGVA